MSTGAFTVFTDEPTVTALGRTIAALYAGKEAGDVAWLAYNDEIRGGGAREQQRALRRMRLAHAENNASASESSAHAKGALLTNGTAGFWLVHSVPKLLDVSASAFTWGAAKTYGQSMLCLSLDATGVEIAATQLTQMMLHASLNSMSTVPTALQRSFPRMMDLLNAKEPEQPSGVSEIKTMGGVSFTSFAKRGSWGRDLYEDLVQPRLGISMAWCVWGEIEEKDGVYGRAAGSNTSSASRRRRLSLSLSHPPSHHPTPPLLLLPPPFPLSQGDVATITLSRIVLHERWLRLRLREHRIHLTLSRGGTIPLHEGPCEVGDHAAESAAGRRIDVHMALRRWH